MVTLEEEYGHLKIAKPLITLAFSDPVIKKVIKRVIKYLIKLSIKRSLERFEIAPAQ